MRVVGLLSWETGTGQNTLAVNLAIGLARQHKRVIILNLNHCMRIYEWLHNEEEVFSFDRRFSSNWGIDFIYPDTVEGFEIENSDYDYAILNIGGEEKDFCKQGIARCDLVIACTRLKSEDECNQLLKLQSNVKKYRQDDTSLDLILPMQIHSGEWKINSQRLFELAEAFGDEIIADFLPHCERIHDLFVQRQSVWQIPQPAIIDAFDRMIKRIEQIT
ncbi:MAG: ParA family protein [Syntrophomonas sp.]